MSWYRTGSVALVSGGKIVTGTGTDFLKNVKEGFGFIGPDLRTYEVESVVSSTELHLTENYSGATAAQQSYKIFPTQGILVDLSTQISSLLVNFSAFRDAYNAGELVGAGLNLKGVLAHVADLPLTATVGDAYMIGTFIYVFSSASTWIGANLVGQTGPANTLSIGTVTGDSVGAATITGSAPNQTLNLVLPKGDQGDIGPDGPSNVLSIGTVTSGEAPSASITGTSPEQVLDLVLVPGEKGDTGPTNELTIGTVTDGDTAAANLTGSAPSQVLNMVFRRGAKGDKGDTGSSFHVDEAGPFSGRSAFDSAAQNFAYLATDTGTLYLHGGSVGVWSDGIPFGKGEPGSDSTLSIGTVESGEIPSATLTGEAPSQILNLVLPKGDDGDVGPANSLTVGSVTTGAEAAVTFTGESPGQVVNFVLPVGSVPTAFSAFNDSELSLTSGVPTKIPFDQEDFDSVSNFDTGTGRFSPASAGYFNLSARAYVSADDFVSSTMTLCKNGTPIATLAGLLTAGVLSGETTVHAAAGDYFEIFVAVIGTGASVTAGSMYNCFSGSAVTTSKGDQGDKGDKGDLGFGIPVGGAPSQILVKTSASDFAVTWQNAPTGSAMAGIPGGYAPLTGANLIPSQYLPSYVDDVLEFTNLSAFPATGESGKIYIAVDTEIQYRWSGSAYVRLIASPGTSDDVFEGATNKYFTAARALSVALTGLSVLTGTPIIATDTILAATGKLQAQITALAASIGTNGQGNRTVSTSAPSGTPGTGDIWMQI